MQKSLEEIELIRESALLVSKTLGLIAKEIKEGVTTLYLDKLAEEFIRDNGGIPGFKGYNGFPNTLCISKDSAVVHGIPLDMEVEEGAILSIDCGVLMNGFYGDSAYTFAVGEISPEKRRLLDITKEALNQGVLAAKSGNTVGDIGFSIQKFVESHGYSIVKELVGHGIGKNLHEEPNVPNYGKSGKGIKLSKGLVIAVEPMLNIGSSAVCTSEDGWTVLTQDGSLSAHFEHTVAVGLDGPDILSDFEIIENEIKKIYG